MTAYLSSLPGEGDIDVVYCENDNMAFGALQALEEQGYRCGREGVSMNGCIHPFPAPFQ